ncbi:hypothetical protein [Murinocardiopsis flavida]|uniref:hypothetical protein n=1 Tax=Murinocardiopsis flavida TaxID=645275 RepID=UPI0011B251A2|nr:hypothetical protein [Murinocardiopsis flavida]
MITLGGVAAAGWLLVGAAPAFADGLDAEAPGQLSSLVQPGPQDQAEQGGVEAAPAPKPAAQPAAPAPQPQQQESAPEPQQQESAPEPAPETEPAPEPEQAAPQGGGPAEGSAVGRTLGAVTDTERAASSLSTVTTGTGKAARSTVDSTAKGAGEVLTSTVRAGSDVGDRAEGALGKPGLTGKVADGLSSSKGLGPGLGRELENSEAGSAVGHITGLTRGDGNGGGGSGAEHRDRPERPAQHDTRTSRSAAKKHTAHTATLDRAAKRDLYAQFADATSADPGDHRDGGSGDDAGAADPGAPHWNKGAESTGAVSSSAAPTMAAAAGFLTHRADARKPLALGAVLPGDPTLVVRDAADDPSFSPD